MPVELLLKSDLPAVTAIESLSPNTSWTEEKLRSIFDVVTSRGIVWRESREIFAYALYGMLPPTAEILNIVVHPDHRRRGIAHKLMQWILNEAHRNSCTEIFLEVRASNHAAIQLYGGFGFQKVHQRKKYYQDGEDAVVMRALLT